MNEKDGIADSIFGNQFTQSLLNNEFDLLPGNYTIMISPHWNPSTLNHTDYQKVLIDVLGPEKIELKELDPQEGFKIFHHSLLRFYKNKAPEEKPENILYFAEENPLYGQDLYTNIDTLDCWYGYIYICNKSKHQALCLFRLDENFKNCNLVYPQDSEEDFDVQL